ncbi:MAG: Serine/threonine phosphatase stp [Firmicutes bacterium ADurb.Bin182]|nr:MAG: Serine/threonine phosphatase stp [Firmicutes bacterium ADurb.Bin182]
MRYASSTNIGKRRRNEDCFYIPPAGSIPLVIVADGMGGHSAGDVASSMAVKVIVSEIEKGDLNAPEQLIRNAINKANRAMFEHAEVHTECGGMGSTVILALLFRNRFLAANIGDSRLYHYDGRSLSQVSIDHTFVREMIASGEITKEQALHHPQRNVITRALGTRRYENADLFERDWNKGDILLLCSDGLYETLDDNYILDMLSCGGDIQEICETLINEAILRGSSDNVTAVLAVNEGGGGI